MFLFWEISAICFTSPGAIFLQPNPEPMSQRPGGDKEFLCEFLKADSRKRKQMFMAEAKRAAISKSPLKRARAQLSVKSWKCGILLYASAFRTVGSRNLHCGKNAPVLSDFADRFLELIRQGLNLGSSDARVQ
jgi:hypothetical protein